MGTTPRRASSSVNGIKAGLCVLGEMMSEKSVIKEPNYTRVPNVFFDEMMRGWDKSKLLIFLAVCRETFGWHRDKYQMSFSDFQEMTGLGRQSVKNGIDALMEDGYLKREQIGQSFLYELVVQREDQSNNRTSSEQSSDGTTTSPTVEPPAAPLEDQSRHDIKEKKETKKKEKESAAAIFTLYADNIGDLKPLVADDLGDLLDEYGEQWLREVIEVSVERNKRSLAYMKATLKACREEGHSPKAPISLEKKIARQYKLPDDYADRPAPEPPPLRVLIEGEGKWQEIAAILKTQLPQETYDSWLSSAVFLGLEDEYFRVGVDRVEAQKVLGGRLYDVILRAVRAVTDEEADIRFELVNGAARRKPGEPDARLGTPAPKLAGQKEQIA